MAMVWPGILASPELALTGDPCEASAGLGMEAPPGRLGGHAVAVRIARLLSSRVTRTAARRRSDNVLGAGGAAPTSEGRIQSVLPLGV